MSGMRYTPKDPSNATHPRQTVRGISLMFRRNVPPRSVFRILRVRLEFADLQDVALFVR